MANLNLTLPNTPTSTTTGLNNTSGSVYNGGLNQTPKLNISSTTPTSNIGSTLTLPTQTQTQNTGLVNSSGKSIMNTVPVATTPSASNVATVKPVIIPTPPVSNTNNSLRATADSYMATPPTNTTVQQNGTVQTNPPPVDTTQNNTTDVGASVDRTGLLSKYLGLQEKIGGQTEARNTLNSTLGVDQKQQNYIDAFNQYQTKKVAYDQQIEKIYNQPGITREQADQQVKEISRVNNADLANLAVITQAAQGNYQAALDIVDRKIKAEFDPVQQQIDNLGKFLQENNANLTDSQKAELQGQITQQTNAKNQMAQAKSDVYQTLIQYGMATQENLSQIDNAKTLGDIYKVGATVTGNPNYGQAGGNQTQNIPQILTGTIATAPSGQQYVDKTKITPGRETASIVAAKNAGIPVLDAGDVDAVRNIDYVKQNIKGMEGVVKDILSTGVGGRAQGLILNPIKNFLQTDTKISTFQGYRDTAIKIIQSLAGGTGSGLRLNQTEIDTATNNIPTINDNLETAQNKIGLLNSFLDAKMSTVFPNVSNQNYGNSSSSGQNIIQTKVGAVDNSWFK